MLIHTTRFGSVEIEPEDILLFPNGLIGFSECRHWVLLADADNDSVGWLQNIARPDLAVAVISPRRFAPEYQVRIARGQLDSLQLSDVDQAYVLVVVGKNDDSLTLNLKAPLVVNLDRRIGRQVVTNDEQPLQFEIAPLPVLLRKSA